MGLLDIILAKLKLQRSLANDEDSFEDVKVDLQSENLKVATADPIIENVGIDPRYLKLLDDRIKKSNEQLLIGVAAVIDEAIGDLEPDAKPSIDQTFEQIRAEIKKTSDVVDEKIKEHAATLDAFIDVVSERVNNDRVLADCFKQDDCPFDPKIKKCPMWMHRPVKNDAPNYCGPCRLQKMLREKGL